MVVDVTLDGVLKLSNRFKDTTIFWCVLVESSSTALTQEAKSA